MLALLSYDIITLILYIFGFLFKKKIASVCFSINFIEKSFMSSLKENVTIEGLSLKYKANCFEKAIEVA
jgi:hypothetical protein